MDDKEDKLDLMHEALANALLARIQDGTATASDLNVARQFLKDNKVESPPNPSGPVKSLAEGLPTFGDDDEEAAIRH
jgi:hypothetical protein